MLISLTFIIILINELSIFTEGKMILQKRSVASRINVFPDMTNLSSDHLGFERRKGFKAKKALTYKISKYSDSGNQTKIDDIIEQAFKIWSEGTVLEFRRIENEGADIDIRFEKREHGDGYPFDGIGNILAHAFSPNVGGAVHFDDDEDWSFKENGGTDLLKVAVHEMGHSLGLRHSDVKTAVMYPYYNFDKNNIKLDPDDIQHVESIYGKPMTNNSKNTRSLWFPFYVNVKHDF